MGGQALDGAAERVIERARKIAGHLLEAAEADIEFAEGRFTVVGTDKRVTLAQAARAGKEDQSQPEEMGGTNEGPHPLGDGKQRSQPSAHLITKEAEHHTETG